MVVKGAVNDSAVGISAFRKPSRRDMAVHRVGHQLTVRAAFASIINFGDFAGSLAANPRPMSGMVIFSRVVFEGNCKPWNPAKHNSNTASHQKLKKTHVINEKMTALLWCQNQNCM
jgi:hypothetical protein